MEAILNEKLCFVNTIPHEDFMYIYNAMSFVENLENDIYLGFYERCDHLIKKGIFERVGNGCNGLVMKYKNYAIKYYYNGNTAYPGKDGEVMHAIGNSLYFPTLYFYYKNTYMVVDLVVNGEPLSLTHTSVEMIEHIQRANDYCILKEILPADLSFCNNILVDEQKIPKIVDVGCFRLNRPYIERNELDAIKTCMEYEYKIRNEVTMLS